MIDLEKLEDERTEAQTDKADLFDFYYKHWDRLIAELRALRETEKKYRGHAHRILAEFVERAEGQHPKYVDGLTVCHTDEIDGG